MELPIVLERMLNTALQYDSLKNWSIYEERDGVYTFKLRFIPRKGSHVKPTSSDIPKQTHSTKSYKRKTTKNVIRDKERNEAYLNRRITRSQARDQECHSKPQTVIQQEKSSVDCGLDEKDSSLEFVSAESPAIETFRHSSFTLSAHAPEFEYLQNLDYTNRLDSESDTDSTVSTPPGLVITGGCIWDCAYGSHHDDGPHQVYVCSKCYPADYSVCSKCISEGAHSGHAKYLKLKTRKK